MREIEFRGKRKNTGEWVYGCYLLNEDEAVIQVKSNMKGTSFRIVIPETVDRYTGLKDKNGVKIFEEDIVKDAAGYEGVVEFTEGAFLVDGDWENDLATIDWEVIGNIHDNPELINRE